MTSETDAKPEDDASAHPDGRDLVSRDFMRLVALWSVVPAYLIAGAFLGWLLDRWLGTFPWGIGIGLIIALVLSVRDMLRLKDVL